MTDAWLQILGLVRRYPSPHNSQPIKVRITAADCAEIFYDTDRGLPAEPYGIPFGFVCVGIFVELFAVAAHAAGFEVVERLSWDDMDFDNADRLHRLGTLTLVPAGAPSADLDPALIAARRTSRLAYEPRNVAPEAIADAAAEARRWGHRLTTTCNQASVAAVLQINHQTLFADLANDAVREELATWLRYSRHEARRKADGLSAECLALPGPVLRWFIQHHLWWQRPALGALARWLYLRFMRSTHQLVWLTGPFATNFDFMRAGRLFIRLWLLLTSHGVALQPLGSVITNPRSQAAFCMAVGEDERNGMTWMLLRVGYSPEPPRSHRLPAAELLVREVA